MNAQIKSHKQEAPISVGTSGAVVIGCSCGWVHRQDGVYKVREKARAAWRAHVALAGPLPSAPPDRHPTAS